ncbi:tRNA (adenosine(37)-N6)-dimethylallyltransferase MiaA [Sphingomonas panacisoli]|uniref:tRNA dimethylallyltransferase n=1 Tax=Sphingomonas panacisoli TaxID=1813879 RepID=A0A5B8LJR1_9SPHN|nr:tRNA (adenosine(37)-N6)-dimethylallyltransferase MiaA [Sphingomonas panacisoli]QDZ07380.1 tRNA (adenosine(37)-N6)-dimethylallyltransferase MiaA [Sphingomonas panacisoli]
MNKNGLPKVALIAGPTASGKSAIALMLAERHGGTIINADSAQVYRDLRIVTARPSTVEEARAPHRLFGHVDAADTGYSAARWASEAREAIDEAIAANILPILVGGTGLYMRTLIDGIAPVPAIDPTIRAEIRAMPTPDAYAELQAADPAQAAKLNATDTTRIARALEVVRSTGRSIASWREQRVGGIGGRVDLAPLILLPPREWLNERIDRRFAAMVDEGAMTEVAALVAREDVPLDAPIRRAIGLPELAAASLGAITVSEAIERASLATRQYAKRQYTWFRNQPPADWKRADGVPDPALLTERLAIGAPSDSQMV